MDTIQVDWKNEKQKLLVMGFLKALHIIFRVMDEAPKINFREKFLKNKYLLARQLMTVEIVAN